MFRSYNLRLTDHAMALCNSGALGLVWGEPALQPVGVYFGIDRLGPQVSPRWWFGYKEARFSATSWNKAIIIPLWFPFLIVVASSTLAWRGHLKRRRSPNACGACGYDRSGLAAGSPCSECGKATV